MLNLAKHEQALITSYRKLGRIKRQLIWILVKDGMQQQGLSIVFENQGGNNA